MDALQTIGENAAFALPMLLKLAADPDDNFASLTTGAIRLLGVLVAAGRVKEEKVLPLLQSLKTDSNPFIRNTARGALYNIAEQKKEKKEVKKK